MLYVVSALLILIGGIVTYVGVQNFLKARHEYSKMSRFTGRLGGFLFVLGGSGAILMGVVGPSMHADYDNKVSSFNDRCHDVGGKVLSLDDHYPLECWKTKLDVPYK